MWVLASAKLQSLGDSSTKKNSSSMASVYHRYDAPASFRKRQKDLSQLAGLALLPGRNGAAGSLSAGILPLAPFAYGEPGKEWHTP